MENHVKVAEYFSRRGVSLIFLFRRNLLRRLVSQLANDHDRNTKQLNGTHKAHVHSTNEVSSSHQQPSTAKSILLFHLGDCNAGQHTRQIQAQDQHLRIDLNSQAHTQVRHRCHGVLQEHPAHCSVLRGPCPESNSELSAALHCSKLHLALLPMYHFSSPEADGCPGVPQSPSEEAG